MNRNDWAHYLNNTLQEAKMNKKKKAGFWKSLENAKKEALKVMKREKLESLPGNSVLTRMGYSMLSYAIDVYHGGFHKFREYLGQDQKELPKGTWKDIQYTLTEAKRIMQKEGWQRLPGGNILQKTGYGGLANSIIMHHGNMRNF